MRRDHHKLGSVERALFRICPVAEFRVDEGMIAVLGPKPRGHPMRAIGEIEPFFGKPKQVAFVGAGCAIERHNESKPFFGIIGPFERGPASGFCSGRGAGR